MSERSITDYFQGQSNKNMLCDPTKQFGFIPAMDKEFLYLMGLEEVVQFRLEMDTVSKKCRTRGRRKKVPKPAGAPLPKDPVTCGQCKTDFSCVWMQDEESSVLCQSCRQCNWTKKFLPPAKTKETCVKSVTSKSPSPSVSSLKQPERESRAIEEKAARHLTRRPSASSGPQSGHQKILGTMSPLGHSPSSLCGVRNDSSSYCSSPSSCSSSSFCLSSTSYTSALLDDSSLHAHSSSDLLSSSLSPSLSCSSPYYSS